MDPFQNNWKHNKYNIKLKEQWVFIISRDYLYLCELRIFVVVSSRVERSVFEDKCWDHVEDQYKLWVPLDLSIQVGTVQWWVCGDAAEPSGSSRRSRPFEGSEQTWGKGTGSKINAFVSWSQVPLVWIQISNNWNNSVYVFQIPSFTLFKSIDIKAFCKVQPQLWFMYHWK